MNNRTRTSVLVVLAIAALLILFVGASAHLTSAAPSANSIYLPLILRPPSGGQACTPPTGDYPTDPTADTDWSAGISGVADIQAAFNNARQKESQMLGISLPSMTLPSQPTWDTMSPSEKAVWLTNSERSARCVLPLTAAEPNVTSVAQKYAQFLYDNNQFGHTADGHDPWWRLDQNPTIQACHDFLGIAENLYAAAGSGPSSVALPVEKAVYFWIYADGGSAWGHRHASLWTRYTNNSGAAADEGFSGVGVASGPNWTYFGSNPYNVIVVENFFDPCATWK